MFGLVLYWFSVYVLVSLSLALIIIGGYLRARYPLHPLYRTTWTRCHQCFDGYHVPHWEVEGFICGNCRNNRNRH
jgi:hypothetical protein